MRLKIIFDADGVLLDYNLQMARMARRALGLELSLIEPRAHHFKAAYGVEFSAEQRALIYEVFDQEGWKSMPAMEGAPEAAQELKRAGHELLCLSSMPTRFEDHRFENLISAGIPVERVIGSGRDEASGENPKAIHVEREAPDVFVEDQLRNFIGIPESVFRVWIDTDRVDGPNVGADRGLADAVFPSALCFARALLAEPERFKKPCATAAERCARMGGGR